MPKNMPKKLTDKHDYVIYQGLKLTMRDGVKLNVAAFFPAKDGVVDFDKKYPVVLFRSPYLGEANGEYALMPFHPENGMDTMGYYLCDNGFVVIINSCRGTHSSEGAYMPMEQEGQDGKEVVEWILKQPWCDGTICTCGASYLGGTQYLMQKEYMKSGTPSPVSSVFQVPAVNLYENSWAYIHEFFDYSNFPFWPLSQALDVIRFKTMPDDIIEKIVEDNAAHGDLIANMMTVRMHDLAKEYGLKNIPVMRWLPYYEQWLDNRDNPEHFDFADTKKIKNDFSKPQLFIGGWYDEFLMNAVGGYEQAVKDSTDESVAKGHRLIMTPFSHFSYPTSKQWPMAQFDQRLAAMEWFEQAVTGEPGEYFKDNPVTLFVMGEDKWRSEKTWPLEDEVRTKFYIHSGGAANTLYGNGKLSMTPPTEEEAPDKYFSNPNDPVYSPGGRGLAKGGSEDQRQIEMRPDVLVYTSDPLEEDIEVTGYIKATVYASTKATDTDFFMSLEDVFPDGSSLNIVTGGKRGRYIKSRTQPEALTPGEIYAFEMKLDATSNVFKKGHRIRVHICSSDAENADVNPNAFVNLNTCTKEDYVVAEQTVYHTPEYATHIELPVIPADRNNKWIEEFPFSEELTGVGKFSYFARTPFVPDPEIIKDWSEVPIEM